MILPATALPYLRLFRFGSFVLVTASFLVSCNTYQDRGTKAPALPKAKQAVQVEAEGARFSALAYDDPRQAELAFGFDILSAGLLPVRIGIENRSGGPVKLIPRQTFLIDLDGQAWPLLTSDQAFGRLGGAGFLVQGVSRIPPLDDLDALTGFAIDMAPAPSSTADAGVWSEKRVSQSLAERKLRNRKVAQGEAGYGALYFPGRNEARNVRSLRLCYEQEGRIKFLTVPLKTPPPFASAK